MNTTHNGANRRGHVGGHQDAAGAGQPSELFRHFAHWTAEFTGSVWVFAAALLMIIIWLATGPLFGYSDAWQLVINTGTTIITFLMVFLIQNTQNRDARAIRSEEHT